MSREAMKQALEALELKCPTFATLVRTNIDVKRDEAITALRQALANEALDRKAENARELGLDYEPMKKCDCAAHSAADCVCGAWDKPEQQPADEPMAWKETDEIECPICKEKAHPYPKCGHIQPVENRFVRELREYAKKFPAAYLFPSWDVQRALKYLDGYTRPQPAAWVGLTDEDALRLWAGDVPRPVMGKNKVLAYARAIEAKLKEKNNG